MPVSFGIEFEFNYIGRDNRPTSLRPRDPWATIPAWGSQHDPTAGSEVCTPAYTDLREACTSISDEFRHWIERNEPYVPYPFNVEGWSLGQHIHIGVNRGRLTRRHKSNIAKAIARVHPFLAALHAQPIPSDRGLSTRYAYPIWQVYYDVPHQDHYCEISASHLGTIEFRLFDANIPQASLTAAFIMKEVAQHHRSNEAAIDTERYRRDRPNGLQHGLQGLSITHYLREVRDLAHNPIIPDVPCIKEVLYLASKYFLSPYHVLRYTHASRYEYFRLMFTHVDKFLDNLLAIHNIQHRERIEAWRDEASEIENIDQLIGLSMASQRLVMEVLAERAPERRLEPIAVARRFTRSMARHAVESRTITINRIGQVVNMSPLDVAERVAQLVNTHGEGFMNTISADHVITSPERFYVAYALHNNGRSTEVLGCISIRMSQGHIGHLVVDRRFRRLGIASMLLDHVIGIRPGTLSAYVRRDNEASLELFKSRGFVATPHNERSLLLRRS